MWSWVRAPRWVVFPAVPEVEDAVTDRGAPASGTYVPMAKAGKEKTTNACVAALMAMARRKASSCPTKEVAVCCVRGRMFAPGSDGEGDMLLLLLGVDPSGHPNQLRVAHLGGGALHVCVHPTARGFEPLRAEPNGFRVHHLSRSVTLSCFGIATGLVIRNCQVCCPRSPALKCLHGHAPGPCPTRRRAASPALGGHRPLAWRPTPPQSTQAGHLLPLVLLFL